MTEKRIGLIGLTYLIFITGLILVRMAANWGFFDLFGDVGGDFMFTLFVQIILMAGLPILVITLNKKQKVSATFEDFKIKKCSKKVILYTIVIGIIVFALNLAISSTFDYFIKFFGYESPTSGIDESKYTGFGRLIAMLVTTAIIPAVCEEIMHRGMLLQGLKVFGVKKAIIISSLLFGLMHLNIGQFFYATIIGTIISIVVLSSGNLVSGMIIHFINNALGVYFTFAYVNDWVGGKFYAILSNILNLFGGVVGFIISFFVLCLLLIGLVIFTAKLYKETRGEELNRRANKMFLKKIFGIELTYPKMQLDTCENNMENTVEVQNLAPDVDTLELLNDEEVCVRKSTFKEKIFFYCVYILAGLVTMFTFIWGLL